MSITRELFTKLLRPVFSEEDTETILQYYTSDANSFERTLRQHVDEELLNDTIPLLNTAKLLSRQYAPDLAREIAEFGYPWFRAGTLIVSPAVEHFLLVKERKVKAKQADGTAVWQASAHGKWNLPSGRLQPCETYEEAAEREALEESGYSVVLEAECLNAHRLDLDNPYDIKIYIARVDESIYPIQFNSEEIAAVSWFSRMAVESLIEKAQVRNAEMIMEALKGYDRIERFSKYPASYTFKPKLDLSGTI